MLLRQLLISKSSYTYPFFWIQEDIGIEELVTVIILPFPLLHKFLQVWSITYEACRNKYEDVLQPRQLKKECSPLNTYSHSFHTKSCSTPRCCRDIPAFSKNIYRPHFPAWNDTRIKSVTFSNRNDTRIKSVTSSNRKAPSIEMLFPQLVACYFSQKSL